MSHDKRITCPVIYFRHTLIGFLDFLNFEKISFLLPGVLYRFVVRSVTAVVSVAAVSVEVIENVDDKGVGGV